MSKKKLTKAVIEQKKQTAPDVPIITGLLGIPINGARTVEVPNRMGFVYVRLRNNQSEVIQAFNNQVAPVYNLPVKVIRRDNKYVILGVDDSRYQNNWTSFAPFLPRHGSTHSFDIESGGGADIVWVYPRQFMPLLALPSGSLGGPNVIVSPYTLQNSNGTWKYVGNTGSPNITQYNPSSVTGAVMGLVFLDTASGNPQLIINSGTVFLNSITGSSQIYPYIPTVTSPATQIPIVAVRLITGTSQLSWDNLYDVRQFVHSQPTGSGGGISSVSVQDEGVAQGSATTFNFVGAGVTASVGGSTATITIPGVSGSSSFTGDPMSVVLTNGTGTLYTAPWLKWGTSLNEYMEFGADEIKETNAGKIGYNVFSDTMPFFHIVGAGTGTGARRVKIYDELYVDSNVYTRNFNITDPSGQYLITGSPHTHHNMTIGGRLTITSNTPVMTGDLSGASIIYWTPYNGRMMPIYNGSNFMMTDLGGELSQLLSDTTKSPTGTVSNSNYDMYIWNDAGTYRCTRGPVWSTSTTRGTGAGTTELERVQGILVNKHDITNGPAAQRGTYVGTIRTSSTNGLNYIFAGAADGGTAGFIGVWNMYNRVSISMVVHDTTTSWTYSNITGTPMNPGGTGGGLNNRISYIAGLAEDTVDASMYSRSRTAAASSAFLQYGIGHDSTSVTSAIATVLTLSTTAVEGAPSCYESFNGDLGFHFIQMIQKGDGTNTSSMFGGANQNGMTLRWRA